MRLENNRKNLYLLLQIFYNEIFGLGSLCFTHIKYRFVPGACNPSQDPDWETCAGLKLELL